MRIEGGPYTPPVHVQYGIRAVRASQVGVGIFFFFGEQILAALGHPPFEFMFDTPTSMMYHAGALYGLNCIASTLKSINAFEIVYNGQVLHSKLETGQFPDVEQVARKLQQVKARTAGGQ